jgi:ABC-type amino acid transport system permease subunit
MGELTVPRSDGSQARRPARGAGLWLIWMVGMWVAFFALLLANQLDGLWSAVRQLPLIVEIVLWVAFLPWMLGMAVWTSPWAGWLRVAIVLGLAAGWILISIPRASKMRST